MKIKISESQLDKITRLNETTINIDSHVTKFNEINKKLNNISNKITFISVAELLKKEVNLKNYSDLLLDLDRLRHKIYMDGYEIIDNIPEAEYDSMGYDFDVILDDQSSKLSDKVIILEDLITKMGEISEYSEKMLSLFDDNNVIEV